ncbi:MAG: hypothetical protein ACRC0G_04080, partial [Fusobacteriaceae bacterium]
DEIEEIDEDIEEFTSREINQQCCEKKIAVLKKHIENDWIVHHLGWVQFRTWLNKQEQFSSVDVGYNDGYFRVAYRATEEMDAYGVAGFNSKMYYDSYDLVEVLSLREELNSNISYYNRERNFMMQYHQPKLVCTSITCGWIEKDRRGDSYENEAICSSEYDLSERLEELKEKDVRDLEVVIVRGGRVLILKTIGKITADNMKEKLLRSVDSYYVNNLQREWLENFINNLK